MAPLAQLEADNIAAYIMREKCSTWCGQGNNSSIGAMGGTTWPKQLYRNTFCKSRCLHGMSVFQYGDSVELM